MSISCTYSSSLCQSGLMKFYLLYVADMITKKEAYDFIMSVCIEDDNWCLMRTKAKNDSWYWVKKIEWKFRYVHRFVYDYNKGIDEWMTVDHICHNQLCCNIEHLRLLSMSDNCRDWSLYYNNKMGYGKKNNVVCPICWVSLLRSESYIREKAIKGNMMYCSKECVGKCCSKYLPRKKP